MYIEKTTYKGLRSSIINQGFDNSPDENPYKHQRQVYKGKTDDSNNIEQYGVKIDVDPSRKQVTEPYVTHNRQR